ncbi:MAG: AmmeMemoRadiSam system protein A [Sedimentisphaerales bacterium]|nr:AmmeMemoRadiSam system protein A [Sedimentisphaerales bacterium]MBN2843287.1 AmmeMemoRadiSam system protein A [Sedimentisphaerales bacterium]
MANIQLTALQKQTLLQIARNVIEAVIKQVEVTCPEFADDIFREKRGCFVTIHNHGQLRGCIGNFSPEGSLLETIVEMAQAACHDSRFLDNPVTVAELADIDIEISVLSPLTKIENPLEIELDRHGIFIRRGFHCGCFLPQVATETGWSKEQFLSYCCSHKAGLPPDAWKQPDTEVLVFTADVFGEKNI